MVVHLTSAGMLPPLEPGEHGPPRLVAMARTPRWVIDLTAGSVDHAFAVGGEIALMDAALAARAMPLFHQGDAAEVRYRAALDARWLEERRKFRPGAWRYTWHSMFHEPPAGAGRRATGAAVPDGAYVVCTCRPHQGCHLRWLAPHLCAVGWEVTLYGVPFALLGDA